MARAGGVVGDDRSAGTPRDVSAAGRGRAVEAVHAVGTVDALATAGPLDPLDPIEPFAPAVPVDGGVPGEGDAVGVVAALPAPCREALGRLQVDGRPLSDVRAWLRELVARHGWPPPLERTLLLLATELAANALDHGPDGGEVVLTVQREGDLLRVAVDDDSAAPPVVRTPPPEAGNGRGMLLVQHLAAAWGTEARSHGGKVVWFTLPVEGT